MLAVQDTDLTIVMRRAVMGLSYGELALAINAADTMSTDRPEGVQEDPIAYAADGLARLGGLTGLRRRHDDSVRLVHQKLYGPDKTAQRAASARHLAMWGGLKRFNRAHDLADQHWCRSA